MIWLIGLPLNGEVLATMRFLVMFSYLEIRQYLHPLYSWRVIPLPFSEGQLKRSAGPRPY